MSTCTYRFHAGELLVRQHVTDSVLHGARSNGPVTACHCVRCDRSRMIWVGKQEKDGDEVPGNVLKGRLRRRSGHRSFLRGAKWLTPRNSDAQIIWNGAPP